MALARQHRRSRRGGVGSFHWPVAVALVCLVWQPGPGKAGGAPDAPLTTVVDGDLPVLVAGKVADGWSDLGWATHSFEGSAAKVEYSKQSGWILSHSEIKTQPGGLLLRLQTAADDFLDVSLDSRAGRPLPKVRVGKANQVGSAQGWTICWLAMDQLNPARQPFDRLVLRSALAEPRSLKLEKVTFTAASPPEIERESGAQPSRRVTAKLDCSRTIRISPLIYGVGPGDVHQAAELGATARRWGGNPSTRYNWKANVWNTGLDWFFHNVAPPPGTSWSAFLAANRQSQLMSAMTLPTIGWVAKDDHSCGFPSSRHVAQQQLTPGGECGNGKGPNGDPLLPGPATQTSVPAPPSFIGEWVREIRTSDGPGDRAVTYLLDNEVTIWNATHRDVHPDPIGYDEVLKSTLDYAAAVRQSDANARIAGFSAWGWLALFDGSERYGLLGAASDRMKHGGKALLPWWLGKLREHEHKTGVRPVDFVDFHYYPQGPGIGVGTDGRTDPDAAARRIRSVRGLWDPTYKDESWIAEPQRLIPRIKSWIEEENPGLGLVIGEYNFGAEAHISGGLALAEALGRFGLLGVDAAYYWILPPKESYAWSAFRAFRNYDGNGAAFGSISVAVTNPETGDSSVFASRTDDGRLVVVALNHDPLRALDLQVDPGTCGAASLGAAWSLADEHGLIPRAVKEPFRLKPFSLAVLSMGPTGAPAK